MTPQEARGYTTASFSAVTRTLCHNLPAVPVLVEYLYHERRDGQECDNALFSCRMNTPQRQRLGIFYADALSAFA